mmetsp:Transcript_21661/g.69966  ORF Transcript_21661/g.69966 Transcript_21661/m.69966 type:complete len:244 (+) Transcript_21661:152-883(+)
MLSSGTVVGIRIEAWCDCWRPKATSRLRHPPQPRKVDAAAATHRTSQLVSWAGRMRLSSSCALQLITPVRTPRSCPGSDPCRRPCRWTSLPVPLQNRRSSRPVPASPSCMGTQTACPGGDCLQKQSTPTFQTQQQVASAMQMGLLLPREPRGRITSFSRLRSVGSWGSTWHLTSAPAASACCAGSARWVSAPFCRRIPASPLPRTSAQPKPKPWSTACRWGSRWQSSTMGRQECPTSRARRAG